MTEDNDNIPSPDDSAEVVQSKTKVVCWGDNSFGECDVPDNLHGVKQISAGANHVAALMDDGTVSCWGGKQFRDGREVVPADLGEVKKVCAGDKHTVALLKNGTVRCWGQTFFGSYDFPSFPEELGEIHEAGRGQVVDISASSHAAAVLIDGTARLWGSNQHGECDGLSEVVEIEQVVAGSMHTVILMKDGRMGAAGLNHGGQCDIPEPLRHSNQLIKQIDADTHTVVLLHGGTVVAVGSARDVTSDYVPVCTNDEHLFCVGFGRVAQIAAGWFRTMLLLEGEFDETTPLCDQVKCCGYSYGESDVPDDIGKVLQISAGSNFTAALVAI